MTNLQTANEIRNQIGHGALYMIGAKNFVGTDNSLTFKVGRNSKKVNYVKIILNSLDLYDMEFIKWNSRKLESTTVSNETNVYNDSLNKLIEKNTGLYTSL